MCGVSHAHSFKDSDNTCVPVAHTLRTQATLAVRDDADLRRVVDYVHFNPVKHGLAVKVKDWPFSSFHRFVRDGLLPPDWGGTHETLVMNFGE